MAWVVVLHAAGGLVLVLAGLGKLRSPSTVSEALQALHLPSGDVVVGLVAGTEIVIGTAGALAGGSWMAWVVAGEWAALALAAIVLARRPQVPCGCFGAPSEPAGPLHVVVDVAFAGLAVATALAADDSLAEAADEARGGWVGVVAAIVLLAVAVRRLLAGPEPATGSRAEQRERVASSPGAGPETAPLLAGDSGGIGIAGSTPDGSPIQIALSGHHRPTLLAFLSDTCFTCREFWTAFADGRAPTGVDVVIVTMGPEDDSPELIGRLAPRAIPTVMSSDAWDHYGVAAGPYFVLVGGDGQVNTHGPASTWSSLEALLEKAASP